MVQAWDPADWMAGGVRLARDAVHQFRAAVAGHSLLLVTLMLVLTVLWTGDALVVSPGYEHVVHHPAFPYFQKTHGLAALAAVLYVAHELQPIVGAAGMLWYWALHIPVFRMTFPANLAEIVRFQLLVIIGLYGVFLIHQRKQVQALLEHQAVHDPLTNLPNRRHLQEELARQLGGGDRHPAHGALIFLDLDGFKYVNDRLGHRTGDELLVDVAAFLRQHLRDRDILVRMGGDEFAVILPHADVERAETAAARLVSALEHHPRRIVGRQIPITASAGIALYPQDGATVEEVLANADIAMHQAKESGRNRVHLYARETDWERFESLLRWEQRIREAVQGDAFPLYCQPIIDLRSNRISQYELLLRMAGPGNQIIAPGAFLDIAGRFGLTKAIDRWVVRNALRLIAEHRRRQRDLCLEVNLSNGVFTDGEFPIFLRQQLAAVDINPANLVLEITETSTIANVDQAQEFMGTLRALGCRFALDDFGVGPSTFHQLKHLPVDYLKIDGAFIQHLPRNQVDQHLVKAMVSVARGLGKQVIAEHVGDDETLRVLRELDVDLGQGYHLGPPQPIGQVLGTAITGVPVA
jgi:diguanylate cyclase (GGDEF)-like protein